MEMVKMLFECGAPGLREDGGWNWCDPDEPVGTHGARCCESFECGCGVSFIGAVTARATTHAVVREVPGDVWEEWRRRFRRHIRIHWPTTRVRMLDRARWCMRDFAALPLRIGQFRPGTVVCIEKLPGGKIQLIPQTPVRGAEIRNE